MTPDLSLNLPVISETPGPEWAELLNEAFEIIDAHDHTEGKGKRITPAALNINADLPFGGNNINSLRGLRMNSQGAVDASGQDIRMLYVRDGELYYNDPNGNEVRITLDGAVDVSATGAITNLEAPAAAVWVDATKLFRFDQDTNQRANMAVARLSLSDPAVANSRTIRLQTPAHASIAESYDITLPPALPSSGVEVLALNSSGNMGLADAAAANALIARSDQFAAGGNPGLVEYYKTGQFNLAGDFSSGAATAVRINDLVHIFIPTLAAHSSSSSPSSGAILPVWARPASSGTLPTNLYNMLVAVGLFKISVTTAGVINFDYRNFSGTSITRTSIGSAASISYVGVDL